MIRKIATWIITHRFIIIGIIALLSLVFAWGITKVEVKTVFQDLLPRNHPFIKIHKKYAHQLGDPLKVLMMLQVREGDIYNYETLEKIKRITNQLDLIPGVNHNQIYSIGSRKIKKVTVTTDSIFADDMMAEAPSSPEEIEALKSDVRNTGGVYGIWVSADEKSAFFTAGFISERVDYNEIFTKVNDIIALESDANHMVYAAGEPMLTGWVYKFGRETYTIFLATILALFALLYFYFRNLVGVLTPVISTIVGAIWGLGFYGLMGFKLEPLTLVLPLLIAARALSHSVQITERYFECYHEKKQVIPACIEASSSILPPGLLGITTDGLGILLIAVAPIPIIQKLAYASSFWAFGIIMTGLILTPVMLSFFTPPKNIADIVDPNKGLEAKILKLVAKLGFGKPAIAVFVGGTILFCITGWIGMQVDLGDINPGSPILWQDSKYNIAVGEINKSFPGTEELYIIMEGSGTKAIRDPVFLRVLTALQRHMEKSPLVASTLSLADLLPPLQRALFAGYPKKEILPVDEAQSGQLMYLLAAKAAPGDFARYFNENEDMANVVVWYRDHMGDTLRAAIVTVEEFVEKNKDQLAEAEVTPQLASGTIGILAAVNQSVKASQLLNFALVMAITFLLCSVTYRSIVAAIFLMVPLNLANLVTLTVMKGMGIGLNINTLPIVSVGVGIGIDYGIYLLSRLCEEYQLNGKRYSFSVLDKALSTTGKAIFFTASTMFFGVIFWYFLSSLRFQAEMGLLLAIIMVVNMIGALILLPSLVYVFKPRFLGKAKLLVKE